MLSVAEGISNGSLPFQFFSAPSIKKTGFDLKKSCVAVDYLGEGGEKIESNFG